MSKVAIITARGGSKRIPRKNIKDFCGKPIIAYSIEAALASGLFDEVMVSTDDKEIADVARTYGASVPFMRSEATSGDYATSGDVLTEVLSEYLVRSQDLPKTAHDCGRFYFARTDAWKSTHSFVMPGCKGFRIDPALAQDIDTLGDWEMAETKYRLWKCEGNANETV